MKTYKYRWLHIPTGKTDVVEINRYTRLEFLELLNQWNRVGPDWKYWEE